MQLVVSSPREAHESLNGLYQHVIKPHTRTGAQGVITWQTKNEHQRLKMRGAFHGPILKAISEQVWFKDERGRAYRYSREVWKHFLKQQFLTPVMEEYTSRKHGGEIRVRQRRLSTEDLSDDEYQTFLMEVQAFATVDLGVEFEEEGY